ncbi:MAG: ABC transporter permease, partial [Vicinamibacterales bacterium]
MVQDLRYALRSLVTQKGFSAVVILCLATGIGVNATIFSVVDGVLIQPFPYAEPDRIGVVQMLRPQSGIRFGGTSYPDFVDFLDAQSRFQSIAATTGRSVTLSDSGEPERYRAGAITWNLFPMLGIAPIHGRHFTAADDAPGAAGVVLIGHDLWTVRYQANPAVVGRRVLLNGLPHEIIGVMPPGFKFPDTRQLWVPAVPLVHRDR